MWISDSEKKVGQGWGHEEGSAELKDETAGETDAKAEAGAPAEGAWGAEANADAWGAPTEGAAAGDAAAAEGRPRREPEEEDNTLTLDEYLKQKKEAELELVPKLEARKANEGDDSIWKDAIAVTKKDEEEDDYFVGKVLSTDISYLHISLTLTILRPRRHPRLVLRRRRRSSSRSMLASNVLSAAAVVAVVVIEATDLAAAGVVAVEAVVRTATPAALLSTSTTRRLSPPWLKEHHQQLS